MTVLASNNSKESLMRRHGSGLGGSRTTISSNNNERGEETGEEAQGAIRSATLMTSVRVS